MPFMKRLVNRRVALDARLRRRLLDLALADARRMHVGLVRQVHQVVDHQAVVAVDVIEPAAVNPFGALGPGQWVQLRRVGERFLARPDPDEAVALDHRIAADRRPHALARHADALAVAAHHQAVVAADDAAVFAYRAERQRRAAVRAEVLERRDRAALGAEQHHAVAADRAAERLRGDLVGGAGDVPGVFQIQGHRRLSEDGTMRHATIVGSRPRGRRARATSPAAAARRPAIAASRQRSRRRRANRRARCSAPSRQNRRRSARVPGRGAAGSSRSGCPGRS